jgi:hypothetical protein
MGIDFRQIKYLEVITYKILSRRNTLNCSFLDLKMTAIFISNFVATF